MLLPPGQLSPEWRGLWWSMYPPDELNGLMHLNICMYGVWGCGGVGVWMACCVGGVRASCSNDKLLQP